MISRKTFTGLPLMKKTLKTLANCVLITLGLTAENV